MDSEPLIRLHLIFGDDREVSCPLFKPGGGGQEVPEIWGSGPADPK